MRAYCNSVESTARPLASCRSVFFRLVTYLRDFSVALATPLPAASCFLCKFCPETGMHPADSRAYPRDTGASLVSRGVSSHDARRFTFLSRQCRLRVFRSQCPFDLDRLRRAIERPQRLGFDRELLRYELTHRKRACSTHFA